MGTSSVAVALLATPKQREGGWATHRVSLHQRFTRASHSEAATED